MTEADVAHLQISTALFGPVWPIAKVSKSFRCQGSPYSGVYQKISDANVVTDNVNVVNHTIWLFNIAIENPL